MKKLLFSCLAAMMLLVGCSSQPKYERSTEAGRLIEIKFDEAMQMIENDETFVFAMTQTHCSHCIAFKEDVLLDYLEKHELYFYDVLLDKEEDTDPMFAFVEKHPNPSKYLTSTMSPTSVYTPTFYFVEKGEVSDIYIGEMKLEELDKYVVQYQLDKAK